MEYSPPPLFKQGASARVKVVFFAVIAVALLMADARLHALTGIRQVIGTVLYPLQAVALMPRDVTYFVTDYFSSLTTLQRENSQLKQEKIANAQTLQQVLHLSAENAQLRKLLSANEQLPVKSVMSEILYDARDAFTRKIIVDRGTQNGVSPGQPVIDDVGIVGQVTRAFPFTSEVTLLTDKDQAIPVQVVRNGLRSIAYGQGHSGYLDLRFMPANADIRNGDLLVTSGIDGVYPAGLSVATVVKVESKSTEAFARIVCEPLAGIGRNRQLLILLTDAKSPPHPGSGDAKDRRAARKGAAQTVAPKDAPKEAARPAPAAPAPMAPARTTPAPAVPATPARTTPAPAVPATPARTTPAPAVPAAPARTTPAPAAPAPAAPAPAAPAPAAPAPMAPAPVAPAPTAPAPVAPAPTAPAPVAPAPTVPSPAPEAPALVAPPPEAPAPEALTSPL